MQVMKFGAVSVSDGLRLRDVVNIVKATVDEDRALVVVCTARPETTDMLINAARVAASGSETQAETVRRELWNRHRALAEKLVTDAWERESLYREWADLLKQFDRMTRAIATLGEPSPRGIDAVAAIGERFVAHLFAVVLRQGGVAARMTDAADLIITDDHFGGAHVDPNTSMERIHKRLSYLTQAGIVPVIAGYIGATSQGIVTTLGRGGGDYTAALIGAALSASEVTIWTDVDGILTADPKFVSDARSLPELSYTEASEIATFGTEVLHPRTLQPLADSHTVLRLRNALRPANQGTAILAQPRNTHAGVRAIISSPNLSMLKVVATVEDGWSSELPAETLAMLNQSGVEILSFAQSFGERSMSLSVRATDADFARDCLRQVFEKHDYHGSATPHISQEAVALVIVITANGSDIEPRVLETLGRNRIHVVALSRAPRGAHLSLILPEDEVAGAIRSLHRDLGLGV